ncbi:unnamed protein product [Rhodiola kirilowii]
MQVRRQLQDIKQGPNETMYDYLEKFNHLERSCCTLGLPEKLIIEYLIDGLRPLDKMLLDASARGSMMNLSLSGIRDLMTNVAENARFREETTRQEEFSRTKNVVKAETPMNSMPEEMKQIKEMMMQILRRQPVPVKPCEFYGSTYHKTDACPTLMEEEPAEVNVVGGYQGYNNNSNDRAGQNRQYGQTTNPSWRQYQQRRPNQYQAGPSNQQEPNKSLDDTMKELAESVNQLGTSLNQFQAKTDGAISELGKQMSQLATSISILTNEPGRLPSQTIPNPKANISMVIMSDMKEALEEAAQPSLTTIEAKKEEFLGMIWEDESHTQSLGELIAMKELEKAQTAALLAKQQGGPAAYKPTAKHFNRRCRPDWNQEEDRPIDGRKWVTHNDNGYYAFTVCMTPPPVTRFNVPASGWDDNKDLDADDPRSGLGIEKIGVRDSSYSMKTIASKYHAAQRNKKEKRLEPMKEQNDLIAKKNVTWSHEVQLEMNKDPGAFTVTCVIGEAQIHHCLIDLGAAVNVLPFHLYCSLGLGPLKPPMISLEMGDKSCVRPVGVFDDLILSVGELFVAADFYVIQTENASKNDPPTIILGRPFLYATKARIDMGKGSLSLKFGGKIANFYIDNNNGRTDTKKPPDIVNTSDPNTLVPNQPKETERVTRPAAMVNGLSPS